MRARSLTCEAPCVAAHRVPMDRDAGQAALAAPCRRARPRGVLRTRARRLRDATRSRPTRQKEGWLAKRLAGNEGYDPDGSRRGCYAAADWLTRSTMRADRCGTAQSRDRSAQLARRPDAGLERSYGPCARAAGTLACAAPSLPAHTAHRAPTTAAHRPRGCAALSRPAQPATTQCAVCATPAICRIAASNCSTGWPPWIRWRSLMITDGTALMPWLW